MEEVFLSYSYLLQTDYVLLEIERNVLDRIRSKKSLSCNCKLINHPYRKSTVKLVLKGYQLLHAHDISESAVVRRIEYSNTLLLASCLKSSHSKAVVSSLNTMYQIQSVKPNQNVLHLLRLCYLTYEELINPKRDRSDLFSFADLALLSNSTPKELADILICKGALVHHGKVRLLDPLFVFSSLRFSIQSSPNFCVKSAILLKYPNLPTFIVKTIIKLYSQSGDGSWGDETKVEDLDPSKVVVALAGFVFLSYDKKVTKEYQSIQAIGMKIQDFINLWTKEIPPSYSNTFCGNVSGSTDNFALLSKLDGNVVVNEKESMIWWLPEDFLPYDIELRLRILFHFNSNKWESQCLRAFVDPLLKSDQSFSHAIQRFTREYRVPGKPVMYSQLAF